jgi:hypothetical protein
VVCRILLEMSTVFHHLSFNVSLGIKAFSEHGTNNPLGIQGAPNTDIYIME